MASLLISNYHFPCESRINPGNSSKLIRVTLEMHRSAHVIMMVADDLAPKQAPGHQLPPCWLDYDYIVTWIILQNTDIMLQPLNKQSSREPGRSAIRCFVLLVGSPSHNHNTLCRIMVNHAVGPGPLLYSPSDVLLQDLTMSWHREIVRKNKGVALIFDGRFGARGVCQNAQWLDKHKPISRGSETSRDLVVKHVLWLSKLKSCVIR